jgi:hypothetical protein
MDSHTTGATSAPTVHPNSSGVSFDTTDPLALARWLNTQHGYDVELPRSDKELARLWHAVGSLIVVYLSGTALVQAEREPSLTLLNGLSRTGGQR